MPFFLLEDMAEIKNMHKSIGKQNGIKIDLLNKND